MTLRLITLLVILFDSKAKKIYVGDTFALAIMTSHLGMNEWTSRVVPRFKVSCKRDEMTELDGFLASGQKFFNLKIFLFLFLNHANISLPRIENGISFRFVIFSIFIADDSRTH